MKRQIPSAEPSPGRGARHGLPSGEFVRGTVTGACLAVGFGLMALTEMGRPVLHDLLRGQGVIGDVVALEGASAERVARARDLFGEAMILVERHHIHESLTEDVAIRMLNAALAEIDAYGRFLRPAESQALSEGGPMPEHPRIGILGSAVEGVFTIEAVMPASAAEKAGLMPGDRVVEVNGRSVAGLTPQEVNARLGEHMATSPDEPVLLGVDRPGASTRRIRVWPERMDQNAVYDLGLREGVLHLHVARFYDGMADHVVEAIERAREAGPLDGVILDLRNDTGGLTAQSVALADVFLPAGQVVYRSSGSKVGDRIHTTRRPPRFADLPVAILVNRFSASASEIFTAAMQAHGRARVVGWPSCGKGTIQRVYPVEDGAIKITVAEYVDPDGREIDGVGVSPDVPVEGDDPGTLPSRFLPDPARETAHRLVRAEAGDGRDR